MEMEKMLGLVVALKLPGLGPELAKQLHAMQPAVGAAAAVGRTSAIASCIPPAASPVAPTVADVLPSFFPLPFQSSEPGTSHGCQPFGVFISIRVLFIQELQPSPFF